ncbi:unnamed protein product, partial [Rotaria magnacalcarata]
MSTSVKTSNIEGTTKVKELSSKKKEITNKQIRLSNVTIRSSPSLSSTAHQQHHSAPPLHNQQTKIGLDAIHENGEYLSKHEQQQQQQ